MQLGDRLHSPAIPDSVQHPPVVKLSAVMEAGAKPQSVIVVSFVLRSNMSDNVAHFNFSF